MKIAMIDSYDSFTYNLVHLVKEMGAEVSVFRNDRFSLEELEPFDKIMLSPGPGIPSEAGLLLDTIRAYEGKKPILGICLGEQAIGEVFGGTLLNLENVYHGVQSECRRIGYDYIFRGLGEKFPVGRYHSWVVDLHSLPPCLMATALSEDGQVMALRHTSMDIRGLQFHPESVLTPDGAKIISNWLNH
ncbi:MAG: aminodeoxychorismate/anthranilate synthase component II [Bacteroidales bacterium]|nr:aminodeoxychorismate/anthranilate synthase component II [Bacteroidales bacterium]